MKQEEGMERNYLENKEAESNVVAVSLNELIPPHRKTTTRSQQS